MSDVIRPKPKKVRVRDLREYRCPRCGCSKLFVVLKDGRSGYYLGWLGRFREGDMRDVGEGEEVVYIECCGCDGVMLDA